MAGEICVQPVFILKKDIDGRKEELIFMAKRGTTAKLWVRSAVIMAIIIIGFILVSARLLYFQTFMAEELEQKAVEQQLSDTTISARRGSIYDKNGKLLAQSVTVWNIVLEPANIKTEDARTKISSGLSEILGVDKSEIYNKSKKNNFYEVVARKVPTYIKDKVIEFGEKLYEEDNIPLSVKYIEDYKRYYTNDNFAADVIGFVGADSQGLAGVEYQYDDYLKGKAGRLVVARNAIGNEMPFPYEQKIDATDGYNLTLSIDENIQKTMEKYVRETLKEFNVGNRGCAIMINVKTGGILGFACEESFDPNEPFEVADKALAQKIDALPEKEQSKAYTDALNKQWRNKGVSDTYIPGSVFKMVMASAVLSEGLIKSDTRFQCSGSYAPFEGAPMIDCWQSSGHGTETLEQALCNSCNPAFMQMGFMLGREKYYEYYVAFGFSDKTGIDLPGESDDIFFSNTSSTAIHGMDLTDLAVGSFGQNFKITPIQMITACAAIANGGNLMKPYVVSQISDSKGNGVKTNETFVKHQVISESVSKQVCKMLQTNAISGGGKNGYVAGYRVGGKTGTSEKTVNEDGTLSSDYIASYCGIAPADDPQVALLCYFDAPDKKINYYGTTVAAPCFRNIMSDVLPYLGIEKVYTEAEIKELDTITGAYIDMTVEEAEIKIKNSSLNFRVEGKGKKVVGQNPSAYSAIPKEGTVILYTEENMIIEKVTVPDFSNLSLADVNTLAAEYNLNICIEGINVNDSGSYVKKQDIPAGEKVDPYTVITLTFNQDNSIM